MGKYNFDIEIKREGTACVKFDLRQNIFGNQHVIPMWVADMDISTPSFILEAIRERCNHPILGYTFRDDAYSNAIVWWYGHRHNWNIKPEWLEFCPGVVSGLNHAIWAFTKPGDRIIIQTPVYHPFFSVVQNNGRVLVQNPLIEKDGNYTMNFEGLEELASKGASMLILSNPHNPVGRVWSKEELLKVGEICLKHKVIVVSDEIHSDLVYSHVKHTSFASINNDFAKNSITFASASKTFNIAGLSSGFAIIPDANLLKLYRQALESTGAGMGNIFGAEAVKSAFTKQGEEWLNELLQYFTGNIDLVDSTLAKYLFNLKFTRPDGTYLLWIDFRNLGLDDESLNKLLIEQAGLGFNTGSGFGIEGKGFQRVNIACPRSTVSLALDRLIQVLGK